MSAAPLHLAGQALLLDPAGALVWPRERVLAVADLHLEKATHFARRGQLLPPFDTRATLDRLTLLLRRYAPAVVVALGDSFHDRDGAARLMPEDRRRLGALAEGRRFIWVTGNHDPEPHDLPGEGVAEWCLAGLVFRHQPQPGAEGEIFGHFHPKATVPGRAGRITRACFVADKRRLLLPAFGAYTGGLDVRASAIAAVFPRGGRVFLIGQERLFSFPMAQTEKEGPGAAQDSPPLRGTR